MLAGLFLAALDLSPAFREWAQYDVVGVGERGVARVFGWAPLFIELWFQGVAPAGVSGDRGHFSTRLGGLL